MQPKVSLKPLKVKLTAVCYPERQLPLHRLSGESNQHPHLQQQYPIRERLPRPSTTEFCMHHYKPEGTASARRLVYLRIEIRELARSHLVAGATPIGHHTASILSLPTDSRPVCATRRVRWSTTAIVHAMIAIRSLRPFLLASPRLSGLDWAREPTSTHHASHTVRRPDTHCTRSPFTSRVLHAAETTRSSKVSGHETCAEAPRRPLKTQYALATNDLTGSAGHPQPERLASPAFLHVPSWAVGTAGGAHTSTMQ